MLSKTIVTGDGEREFQIRVLPEEGAGLLTTRSDKSYFLLDSLDYWYDLIQTSYPKKKKCKCSNEWFAVQFDYALRPDEEDIKSVQITATCTNCGKLSKVMFIDFKYSPTLQFLEQPINYCEKPIIRYKYKELNSYWKYEDLKLFLQFMAEDLQLHVYCYYAEHPQNTRHFEKITYDRAVEITTANHRYFDFYFSLNEIADKSDMICGSNESDVVPKKDLWRRNELIHLSMPYSIMGYGILYYIHYCAQYLDKGEVVNKSPEFEKTTHKVEIWLKSTFVTSRGKNSFDGEEAHKQVMAKLNLKR
jgi:hypothetical protein